MCGRGGGECAHPSLPQPSSLPGPAFRNDCCSYRRHQVAAAVHHDQCRHSPYPAPALVLAQSAFRDDHCSYRRDQPAAAVHRDQCRRAEPIRFWQLSHWHHPNRRWRLHSERPNPAGQFWKTGAGGSWEGWGRCTLSFLPSAPSQRASPPCRSIVLKTGTGGGWADGRAGLLKQALQTPHRSCTFC